MNSEAQVLYFSEKVSVFGRVILQNIRYTSDSMLSQSVEKKLMGSYLLNRRIKAVHVLELESDHGLTLCHYELVLDDQRIPPMMDDLTLVDKMHTPTHQ